MNTSTLPRCSAPVKITDPALICPSQHYWVHSEIGTHGVVTGRQARENLIRLAFTTHSVYYTLDA
jgi:hypothetical protein